MDLSISRILLITYFPLFFLGIEFSNRLGQTWIKGFFLIPSIIYAFSALLRHYKNISQFSIIFYGLLFIQILYSVLCFPHKYSFFSSIFISFLLIGHTMFFYFIPKNHFYSNNSHIIAHDLFKSLFICFFMTSILPLFILQDISIYQELGGAYNTKDVWFYMTTLNAPFIASLVMIFSTYLIINFRKNGNYLFYIFSFFLSFSCLLLYSRRGPIFAAILVAVLLLKEKWMYKIKFWHFLLLFLAPFYWDFLSSLLIASTQNDFINIFVARNDPETYLSATGRTFIWIKSIQFLVSDFSSSHLFGYGEMPNFLLTNSSLNHAHNAIFQLFFESGLLAVFSFLFIYYLFIKRIKKILDFHLVKILFALIIYWNIISMAEPILRFTYFPALFFLSNICILVSYFDTKLIKK